MADEVTTGGSTPPGTEEARVVDARVDGHVSFVPLRNDAGDIVDFTFANANPAACALLRLPLHELVGRRLLEVHPTIAAVGIVDKMVHAYEASLPLVLDDVQVGDDAAATGRYFDIRAMRVDDQLTYTWRDVTSRHRLSDRFNDLTSVIVNDVMIRLSVDGTIEWASPSVVQALGWAPDDIVGQNLLAYTATSDELTALLANPPVVGDSAQATLAMRTVRGEARTFRTTVRSVDSGGETTSLVLTLHFSETMTGDRSFMEQSTSLYDLLISHMSDVMTLTTRDDAFTWVSPSVQAQLGRTPLSLVGTRCEHLVHPDELELYRSTLERLRHGERTRCVVRVAHTDGEWHWMSIDTHPLAMPSQTTVHFSVWRNVDTEVATRLKLDASQRYFQMVAEHASDVVCLLEPDGMIQWASPSVGTILGIPAESLFGHQVSNLVMEEDHSTMLALRDRVLRSRRPEHAELRVRTAGGEVRWMSVNASPDGEHRGEAMVSSFIIGLRDITVEVATRSALMTSERQFRLLAENATDVVIQQDAQNRIVWVSPSLQKVLGWRPQDLLGMSSLDVVAPLDRARAEAWLSLVHSGERVRSAQMRYRLASGEVRWMQVTAEPLTQQGPNPHGFVVTLRDCHDEVVARRALSTLSASGRTLVSAGSEQDLLATMCQAAVNEGGYLLAWYLRPRGITQGTFESVASSDDFHEYRAGVTFGWGGGEESRNPAAVALRTDHTVVVNNRVADTRFALDHDEATTHGFRSCVALPVRTHGKIDGILVIEAPEIGAFDPFVVGILEDFCSEMAFRLTTLRDQERLSKALGDQFLLSAAISQAGEAVVMTDPRGNLIYANPAALHSSGYEWKEIEGRNPRVFQSGLQPRSFYDDMWHQLVSGQSWRGTIVNKRKNGEFYEEEATMSPVHNAEGQLMAYVSVKRDLSVEHRLQANLSRDERDRTTILDIMRLMRPASNVEAMASSFCHLVRQLPFVDGAALFMVEGDSLRVMGSDGVAHLNANATLATGPVHESFRNGAQATLLTMDRDTWTGSLELFDVLDRNGARNVVLIPLHWNSELIGEVVLASRDPSGDNQLGLRLTTFDQLGEYAGTYFGSQLEERSRRDASRRRIQTIIDERAFRPVFQPFVDLASGTVVGYEALTRFTDGQRPDECVAEAHRCGLGPELEVALARAAVDASRHLPPTIWLSLNFSPAALLGHYVDPFFERSSRTLVVEITEHDPIENYAAVRAAVAALPQCKLAIDDAGAGYTSLQHILELEPHYIKLDISLIRDIDSDPARQAMTAGMCHFAAMTGTILIAEGVETRAEAEALLALGVPLTESLQFLGQGYLFGRPAAIDGAA